MRLTLHPTLTGLEDPEDFAALSAEVPSHVWVTRQEMIAASGRDDDEEWISSLDAMIDYARTHGFADENGRVRAHVVVAETDAQHV